MAAHPRSRPRRQLVLPVALAALVAIAPGTAPTATAATATAAAKPELPGRFVVRGPPLARQGRVTAGRSISVFARPAAVVVEGCRTRSRRVRVGRSRAAIAARVSCAGIRGRITVTGAVTRGVLRGTARRGRRSRRFSARLRPPPGVLLRGRPSSRALGAVPSTNELERHSPATISTTRGGLRVARTEISVRLAQAATIAPVNAALRAVGGRIAGSVPGARQVAVAIPDPGSLGALTALVERLGRLRGIDRAALADIAATNELPPGFASQLAGNGATRLSHLLALRMPAAWHARAASSPANRPLLIIADHFGNGPLSAHVDASYNRRELRRRLTQLNANGRRVPLRSEHGYHAVGIAAGSFANDGSDAGAVTGVFPGTSRLAVLDELARTSFAIQLEIIQLARRTSGRVVVNTSLGYPAAPGLPPDVSDAEAREDGLDWAELVRRDDLEERMLHATSAGNAAGRTDINSRWTASLRPDLRDGSGATIAPLRNTLAVENIADTGAPAFQPGCLSLTSNRGGTVAAVGTGVFSHRFTPLAGDLDGTSQSSPQVAALGAYLWSIAPDLSAPQLRGLMVATAAPPLPNDAANCGTDLPSAPRLDAYAAVLSLDGSRQLTPAEATVRHAIVDRDGNGSFDSQDLAAFADARRADSFERDWSRSDLNGDGFTGGEAHRTALDLDPSGSPRGGAAQLGIATAMIGGSPVQFDERSVSDKDALCFWAYSGLYGGSPAARASLLSPADCGAVPSRAGAITITNRAGVASAGASCGDQGNGSTDEASPPFGTGPVVWSDSATADCPAGSEGSAHGDVTHNALLSVDAATGVVTIRGDGSGNASCTDPGGAGGGNGCGAKGERMFEVLFTVSGTVAYTLSGSASAGGAVILEPAGGGTRVEDHSGTFSLNRSGTLPAGDWRFEEGTTARVTIPPFVAGPIGPRSDSASAGSDVTLSLQP